MWQMAGTWDATPERFASHMTLLSPVPALALGTAEVLVKWDWHVRDFR